VLLVVPLGVLLIQSVTHQPGLDPFLGLRVVTPYTILYRSAGATAGAWLLTAIYGLSIALTALVTLPELRRRAMQSQANSANT